MTVQATSLSLGLKRASSTLARIGAGNESTAAIGTLEPLAVKAGLGQG